MEFQVRASGLAVLLIVAMVATNGCKKAEQSKNVTPAKPKIYTVSGGPAIGDLAPEIVGVDLDGVEFKLSDYRGKVVMLDFYGDW